MNRPFYPTRVEIGIALLSAWILLFSIGVLSAGIGMYKYINASAPGQVQDFKNPRGRDLRSKPCYRQFEPHIHKLLKEAPTEQPEPYKRFNKKFSPAYIPRDISL